MHPVEHAVARLVLVHHHLPLWSQRGRPLRGSLAWRHHIGFVSANQVASFIKGQAHESTCRK